MKLRYKHSEESKRKISKALKGRISPKKGIKLSKEVRLKMREASLKDGRIPPSFKGKKHSKLSKQKMSKVHKGRKDTEETTKHRIASVRRGKDCHFWKGGITPLRILIKQNYRYKKWRSLIFKRDNFICQICGQLGGRLNADHIKSFSLSIEHNNIKTLKEAFQCKDLWDINNGRTLCEDCHRKTDNFGSKGRVSYQNKAKTISKTKAPASTGKKPQ